MKLNNKGFTLIELLVVISIIGVLSSIVMSSLNSARTKARDAVRISDVKQMATALEMYANDNYTYPAATTAKCDSSPTDWASLQSALSAYIPSLPKDPLKKGNPGGYCYFNDGSIVYIKFFVENNLTNIGNTTNYSWDSSYGSYQRVRYFTN